jgi:hypothetical protein
VSPSSKRTRIRCRRCSGHGATCRARRRARRDGRGLTIAVRTLEGQVRPHARPRARPHGGPGAHGGGHGACAGTRSTPWPGCSPSSSRRPSARRTRTATGTATLGGTARSPRSRPTRTTDDDDDAGYVDDDTLDEDGVHGRRPGRGRRYRFRHPTASGKTIAAAGFVEAARHLGVLILTHRRLLVSQFTRDLTTEGYGDRFTDPIVTGSKPPIENPITIQTYAWFARHGAELDGKAYHLVICDEAHTALGEKTSGAIRAFSEPLYIG